MLESYKKMYEALYNSARLTKKMVYGSPENLKMKFPMIHEPVKKSIYADMVNNKSIMSNSGSYVKTQIEYDYKLRNISKDDNFKYVYEPNCNTLTGFHFGKTQQHADKCRQQHRIGKLINQYLNASKSYYDNFKNTAIQNTNEIVNATLGETTMSQPYMEKTIQLMHHFAKHAYVEVRPSDQYVIYNITDKFTGNQTPSHIVENGYRFTNPTNVFTGDDKNTFYINKKLDNKPYIYSTFRGKYLESFRPSNIAIDTNMDYTPNYSEIMKLYILNRYVNHPEYKSKIPKNTENTLSADLDTYKLSQKLPTKQSVDSSKTTDIFEKNKLIIEWADFDFVEHFETYILNKYMRTQGTLAELQSKSKDATAATKPAPVVATNTIMPTKTTTTSTSTNTTTPTPTSPAPTKTTAPAPALTTTAPATKSALARFFGMGGKRKTRNHRKSRRLRKRLYHKTYKH